MRKTSRNFLPLTVTKLWHFLNGWGPDLLWTVANAGGSAGTRTQDHLIKSHVTPIFHNNWQSNTAGISMWCTISNKVQYCTNLRASATILQHFLISPPIPPMGNPHLFSFGERDNPEIKISYSIRYTRLT